VKDGDWSVGNLPTHSPKLTAGKLVNRDSGVRYDAFAVAAPGLEFLVENELRDLGVAALRRIGGGVEYSATQRQLYESNLHLRTASRIIVRLAEFKALTFADLERRAKRVPWEKVIAKAQAVTLRVTCRKSRLYHSDAVAERITRDLVERMKVDVSTTHEDEAEESNESAQLIIVRFDRDRCTISADSSGAHLHQRGYRTSVTQAPMRETLAAALVMASGWDQRAPLLDPFCGSGTIPIEAALLAAQIAPGRNRKFQLMQWPDFDAAEWKQVLARANSRVRHDSTLVIAGSDRNAAALRASRENAERAGVIGMLRLEKADALDLSDQGPEGWIVSNPPYGVRLGDRAESQRLLSRFGQRLRDEFAGWHVAILAPAGAERLIGLPLESRLKTTNGGLRVQVLVGTVPSPARQSPTRSGARP
jgi:putative N6-adenine-specific DNA methylase